MESEWSAGDALNFYAGILSFLGTIILGIVSIWQIKKANNISEQLLKKDLLETTDFIQLENKFEASFKHNNNTKITWTKHHKLDYSANILIELYWNNEKVVINTCQSCGGSPYAYFVQVGNKIQCQNCGNMFAIDELDNLVEDGCNPIAVEDKQTKDGIIIIGTNQLKELKGKFENWKGPKA